MKLIVTLAVAAILAAPAVAAPCRDTKGHFTKCPSTAPAGIAKDAKGRCHAAGGKFVACPK